MTLALERIFEARTAADKAEKRVLARAHEAFSDPESMSGRVDAVHRAFTTIYPSDYERGDINVVEEIYEDRILARLSDKTFQIPYEVNDDDEVEFGSKQKVKVSLRVSEVTEGLHLEDIEEATFDGLTIREAIEGTEGSVWRVTMVRPGISGNQKRYRPEVLADAVNLYEGVKSFDGHRDPGERRKSAIGNLAGWHDSVSVEPDGALSSDFHITEGRQDVRTLFLDAWKSKRPNLFGFSHDVAAATENVIIDGKRITDVRKIVEVHSVDVVADPSAGGQIERLVASRHNQEETMTLEEFLRALRAGDLSAEQLTEAYEANPDWEQIVEAAAVSPDDPDPDPDPDPAPDSAAGGLTGAVRDMVIANEMSNRNIPEAAQENLVESLEGVNDEEQIRETIERTGDIWAAAASARPAQLAGQGRVEVGEEDREKLEHGLDAMILGEREVEGTPAFRGLKEAYVAFTGRNPFQMGEDDFNRWLLAESVGTVPYAGAQRLMESLTTASWGEALGDSIRRALVAEYSMDAYGTWRQIVSEVGNIPDFRTNRRVRVGGYDVLPTVAEGAPYTALTSPLDEEATFAGTKKGGTEDLTLETIANDDLGAVRAIPRKLGRAAALTLYRAIWNTTIAGNATIYDAVALFDAAHNNTSAAALAEAGVQTLRTAMVKQTQSGEPSGFIGLTPRFLAVPTDLHVTAFKLTQSGTSVVGSAESATTPNPFQGLIPIEVPSFTDVDDWFLIADPNTVPTIEVGYYQGRQDPELFIQDQPAVGSVFTADKITYKIRHIWGLAVLDFRGFQRGTV